MATSVPDRDALRTTPLHSLHQELGGRLVDFAGWELPIQYEGVIAEHTACRTGAALFDVSHMAVLELAGSPDDPVIDAIETLTPASIATLEPGRQRYALLTNEAGGVIDDCMVTRLDEHRLMVVVNASRRDVDVAHLRSSLPTIEVVERTDLAFLALQGPAAVDVLGPRCPGAADLLFGRFANLDIELDAGTLSGVGVSRSGYTGEDGFELAVDGDRAIELARALLGDERVAPAGLGARDTLRLEAGLALYGNDLDETTSPVEANLTWTMPKRRREDRRFLGAEVILDHYDNGPARRRVGLRPTGRRPVRDGAELRTPAGEPVGSVTSGGYGPTVGGPVAMGYVTTAEAEPGRALVAEVRGAEVEIEVAELPFTEHRYHRGPSS